MRVLRSERASVRVWPWPGMDISGIIMMDFLMVASSHRAASAGICFFYPYFFTCGSYGWTVMCHSVLDFYSFCQFPFPLDRTYTTPSVWDYCVLSVVS